MAAGEVDWKRFVRAALAARVAPLVYATWREEPLLPGPVRRRLRREAFATAYRNAILLHEIEQVVVALQAVGVAPLLLKGAALAPSVYRSIAVRPLADVDVLIRRAQVAAARQTVAGLGFAAARADTRDGAAPAYENELLLIKPGARPVPLELHWSLFDSPFHQQRIDLEPCWRAAVPLRLDGVDARMLDPVSLLVHLCGHLVLHHGGADLLWEHDIFEVLHLHGARLDWQAVLDRATEWQVVLPLQRLLLPLVEEGAVSIDGEIVAALRRLQPTAGERRAVAQRTAGARSARRRFWDDLAALPTWRQRAGYAWTHLVPSAQYMRERYGIRHAALLPLYYPYRWYRGGRGSP